MLTYKCIFTRCRMLAILLNNDVNYDLRVFVFCITDEKDTLAWVGGICTMQAMYAVVLKLEASCANIERVCSPQISNTVTFNCFERL